MRNVNRRHFLKLASAGAVAVASLQAPLAAAQPGTSPQVLILGAGMAGAAAAYWLRKFGISALVLEARDRVGGRIWSSFRWPDAPIDLGAAWLVDPSHSPLTPFTSAFNIKTVATNFFNYQMFRTNGASISAATAAAYLALYGAVEA